MNKKSIFLATLLVVLFLASAAAISLAYLAQSQCSALGIEFGYPKIVGWHLEIICQYRLDVPLKDLVPSVFAMVPSINL